jgi:hypothetical protein
VPLLWLGAGVEHSFFAGQDLCLDDIDLAGTLRAPQARASAAPDGQNLVGLDDDLGSFVRFMIRVRFPLSLKTALPQRLKPRPFKTSPG